MACFSNFGKEGIFAWFGTQHPSLFDLRAKNFELICGLMD